jgi:hypothetical protein
VNLIVDTDSKRKRKSRISTNTAGKRLVLSELVKRGFDVQLADSSAGQYDLLVAPHDSAPRPIQVITVNFAPWLVRRVSFLKAIADRVTVCVLLENDKPKSARFFLPGTVIFWLRFARSRIGNTLYLSISK